MRTLLLAVLFAACSSSTPPAEAPAADAKPVEAAAPKADDHAGHDHAKADDHAGHDHAKADAAAVGKPDANNVVQVQATAEGFTPSRIEVTAGKPVKLVFTRAIEKTCMTGVVFPELGIEKDLPLNTPVEVEVTPKEGGTIAFQCPMGMGKSAIVTMPNS